jgi:hypothetical protein
MQGAFSVLYGESIAVTHDLYQEMAFSHSLSISDREDSLWRDIEYKLAELPKEERTPEAEKQIIDSVYKRWGVETPELKRRMDREPVSEKGIQPER